MEISEEHGTLSFADLDVFACLACSAYSFSYSSLAFASYRTGEFEVEVFLLS